MVYMRWNDPSPAPKRLSKPTKVDKPLPKSQTISWWLPSRYRVSECETHSFVNTKHWKRMDVNKWTIEDNRRYDLRTTHYLQCLMKDLSA
ncbi:hypothetical protein AAVH_27378 [Aphelenchoides avenae]|nr:hypothetical protein AAVH_27378 [Aphelenchus avenae]